MRTWLMSRIGLLTLATVIVIIEVIPLLEHFTTLDGQLLGDWRYRELPRWRVVQRWRQHSARRARRRARLALAAARAHEDAWAKPPGVQKSS